MVAGKVRHWKHGWIPLDGVALAEARKRGIKVSPADAKAAKANPGGLDFRSMTPDQKIRAAEIMHGTGSRQHKAAQKRFGPKVTNAKSLGEQIKADPRDLTAPARGGGAPYSAKYVDADGHFTPEREALHRQIIEDHLRGIKPSGKQPVQYMNGGGPGSGKSSLRTGDNARITGYPATREADDKTGKFDLSQPASAVLIDPDAVKAMLPEVKTARANGDSDWAAKSHEESSYLAKRIHAAALDRGLDVVYDGTGDGGLSSVEKKIALAKAKGYRVEGNYIYLDPDEGVRRATSRAARTGRVVPEATIRETYRDVSSTFGQVAQTSDFDVLRVFDNNAPNARLIAEVDSGNLSVKDPGAYHRFLANGE